MMVEVTVVPNSRKFSISVKDSRVKIHLKNPPENNKANIELIKELSGRLGCPVSIVSGQTSKRKRLEIGTSEQEWKKFLSDQ